MREVARQLGGREASPWRAPDHDMVLRVPAPTTLDRVRQLERRQLDLEAVMYGGLALLIFIFIISRR